MNAHALTLKVGISRGTATYGYTLMTLRDEFGKVYRTCGGGYDMQGTVFGKWLATRYQTELRAIGARAASWYSKADGYKVAQLRYHPTGTGVPVDFKPIYGMTRNDDTGAISLDGACGIGRMIDIAKLVGLHVRRTGDSKGRTVGYLVTTSDAQGVADMEYRI